MKYIALALVALALTGCSEASKAWFKDARASLVANVKELAPAYCKIRPQTNLDDIALAAVALATSEQAANLLKASADKVCSWVGEPVAPKVEQAEVEIPADVLRLLPYPLPRVR